MHQETQNFKKNYWRSHILTQNWKKSGKLVDQEKSGNFHEICPKIEKLIGVLVESQGDNFKRCHPLEPTNNSSREFKPKLDAFETHFVYFQNASKKN